MGLVLGVPAEILRNQETPYLPVCKRTPIIFLEIGFPTGVPESRIEIRLNKNKDCPLVKELLRLCTENKEKSDGFLYSFKNLPITHIDSVHGMIMFGDKIKSEVWNNFTDVPYLKKSSFQSGTVFESGSVFLLPSDLGSKLPSSTFFITTQKQPIYEGIHVGQIIQGLESLEGVVNEFGSKSGIPKKTPIIMESGQV